jgi:hypothetical protein
LPQTAYAYLLGLYLGDGCLSEHPRGVYHLRVACAARYPDQLGIEWRQNNRVTLSVARRGSVALLDQFVGPKR